MGGPLPIYLIAPNSLPKPPKSLKLSNCGNLGSSKFSLSAKTQKVTRPDGADGCSEQRRLTPGIPMNLPYLRLGFLVWPVKDMLWGGPISS